MAGQVSAYRYRHVWHAGPGGVTCDGPAAGAAASSVVGGMPDEDDDEPGLAMAALDEAGRRGGDAQRWRSLREVSHELAPRHWLWLWDEDSDSDSDQ